MKFNFIFFLLLFFVGSSSAFMQRMTCEDLKPVSSKLIDDGIAAYDKEMYEDAIKCYLKILPGDSNYYTALYELGLTYSALKKNDEVVKIANQLLKMEEGSRSQNINLLGSALDDLGRSEEALAVYDDAIKKYPNDFLLHYNRGVTLFLAKRYNEAEKAFIRAAQLNPVHQGSNYFLGVINLMAERYIQGLMALEYAMVLRNQTSKYTSAISILDESSVLQFPKKEDMIKLGKSETDAYNSVNEIYASLIALNAKYKPKKLPALRVVKQTALFFDNIESIDATDNSFYTQHYLKFFKKIKEKKQVRTFIAQVFSNTNNAELNKLLASEQANLDKLDVSFKEFVGETASKVNIEYLGKTYYCSVQYNNDGGISSAYELDETGNQISMDGMVLAFYDNGGIFKEARLKGGELDSECKIYDSKGNLGEINVLENGTEQGKATEYYETGELQTTKSYKDGKIEGEVKIFYPDGKLKTTYILNDGLRNGEERSYYNDGKLASVYHYDQGEFNGKMEDYYHNGKVQYEYSYINGKLDGSLTSYYPNGAQQAVKSFKAGTEVGVSKSYFPNGNLKEEGQFDEKGKHTGVWKAYFYNGALSREYSYLNGQKQGKGVEYDRDGIKHYEFEYNGGNYTSILFFDKKGNVIKEFKEEKNVLNYSFYSPDGIKEFDGALKNGENDGLWSNYYTTTGTIFKTSNYKKGELNGLITEYFGDGKIKGEFGYEDGVQKGMAVTYYEDGVTLKSQYCAEEGEISGRCINYFPNGSKHDEAWYNAGKLNGPVTYYDLLGRIHSVNTYKEGVFVGEQIYDSLGNVLFESKIKPGLQPYTTYYPNGNIKTKGTYLNDDLHDTLWRYYPDGKVWSVFYYENGKAEGKALVYDHLGNLLEEKNFANGNLNGTFTAYYNNGKISEIKQYMDGNEYGETQSFYSNGAKEFLVNIENGLNEGWGTWFDENGNEMHKTFYLADDPVFYMYKDKTSKWVDAISLPESKGVMKSFYPNGKKFIERNYFGSSIDGTSTVYFADGSVYYAYSYAKGVRNGSSKEYYANKKLRKDENFWMGELHGTQKYYNENGTLFMELNYEFGNLNGSCKYYDKNGKLLYTCLYYQDMAIEVK
jgi:antitoxin component YwqK of YwqJK toxin-antitoxin module